MLRKIFWPENGSTKRVVKLHNYCYMICDSPVNSNSAMDSRNMRCKRNVTGKGRKGKLTKLRSRNLNELIYLKDLDVDMRIILKWILKKHYNNAFRLES